MLRSLFLACGLGLGLALGGPASAQSQTVPQAAVDAAVARGAAHLLALYADGYGRDPRPLGDPGQPGAPGSDGPRLELVDRPGLRALTVYALLKSGVDAHHVVVERLLAHLAFDRFDRTYDASCMVLALSALDPVANREWIGEIATQLLEGRAASGEFGYPGGDGDLSNTQFGALALRAAAATGLEVGPDVWTGIAQAVLRHKTREGGFAYVAASRKPTGSMTVAGVGVLALCRERLAAAGALTPDLRDRLPRECDAGLRWLARNFAVDHNPEGSSWTHYYLYGLERMGALAAVDRVGEHDWYDEGAAYLLKTQHGDGSWAGTFEREPTLFALLFLRRATGGPAPRTRDADDPSAPRADPASPTGTIAPVRGSPRLRNLLVDAHAKVSASSALGDPTGASPEGFSARCAVDQNARSPWIAAANDDAPTLRITLTSARKANRVRIAPAILFPRAPAFLGRARVVAIRVNGAPFREARFPLDGGWAELRLEKTVPVQDLELRLLGRDPAGKTVGIGEVELGLAPE